MSDWTEGQAPANWIDVDFYWSGCHVASCCGVLQRQRLLVETFQVKGVMEEDFRLGLEVALLTYSRYTLCFSIKESEWPTWSEAGAKRNGLVDSQGYLDVSINTAHYRPLTGGWLIPRRFYQKLVRVKNMRND